MRVVPLIVFLLLSSAALAQECTPPGLEFGPHPVGYRSERMEDRGRSFGARLELDGTPVAAPPWRPVQLHLWYPAAAGEGAPMRYREYVSAVAAIGVPLGEPGPDPASVVDHWKASPLRREADEAKLDAVLAQTLRARRDAVAAEGPFPLVLYSPSINSDPSENAALFEWLASWGYVIASAPSMGHDEVEVSRDAAGARGQLDDLRFVLVQAAEECFVDAERLGTVGFSWGGMAALLLTLEHEAVRAAVCLDGGMRFPDYEPVAASFPCWSASKLRAALLEISLADAPRVASLGERARYADVHLWSQPGMLHRDFSWDAILRYRHATGDEDYARIAAIYGEWAQALKAFLDDRLKGEGEAWRRFDSTGPRSEGATWASRAGAPPPPTPAQFVRIAEEQGVDAVVARVRALRSDDPGYLPYDEERMLRFVYSWGPDRAEELQRLLELNLELYPESSETCFWMAQVHLSMGQQEKAVTSLEAALARDPSHERAQRLLARLKPSEE